MSSQNNEKKKKNGGGRALLIFLVIFLLPRLFELLEDRNLGRMFRRLSLQLDFWLYRNGIPIRGETMLWILGILAVLLLVTLITKAKGGRKNREDDHFVRDKAQRIAQLDEWLKNGLIDREEYRVLKSRYERDL